MRRKLVMATLVFAALVPTLTYSEYGDVVLDKHKETMAEVGLAPVVFPHWFHRMRFKCKACHEEIFVMQKGASDITMSSIIKGEFCGKCHNGKKAFATKDGKDCSRCHIKK